jgi:N-methylhydantoinase A
MTGFRVGVDIGGTFTDIVLINAEGRLVTKKISSSVSNYATAIVDGLAELFDSAGIAADEIQEVMHGTTVASNAILELKGAKVGLIGTDGFRDILEIRNLRMPRLYDLEWVKPPPLVERYLRVTVQERIDAKGNIEQELTREDAEAAVSKLVDQGVEAIAVCLLNSYANPVHEKLIAEAIEAKAPGLPYCISFDILPEIKEYERTSTTVVNAYILPIVSKYLQSLEENFAAKDITAPVLLMQSNGGLTPAAEAALKPGP